MPFRYAFDTESRTFSATGEGTVTGEELLAFSATRPDPPGPIERALIDLSDCVIGASGQELRVVADRLAQRPAGGPSIRMALVGGTEVNYGILRQYAVFRSGTGLEIVVFRERDEALAWLRADADG